MAVDKFCFRFDLKKGALFYAWFQMMPIALILNKCLWLTNTIYTYSSNDFLYFSVSQLNFLSAIQVIKILSSFALMWGISKGNYMLYQPWLFINGLENSLLILLTIAFFITGFFTYWSFIFSAVTLILVVYGWYIWSCVYVLYKEEIKPGLLKCEEEVV